MDICLYMRMSTSLQENSIESQQKILRSFAEANKMHIVAEYTDEGISGRKADKRPAFMQMIDDSGKGMFETVLIYDSSRFARNLEEAIVYKSLLKKNGVNLVSATEPTLDDDTSLMTDALLGAMNEMYSRKLSKTVRRGMEFKVEQGYFQNKPPYGYISAKNGDVALVNTEQSEVVKTIFKLFTTSIPSFLGIAKELNRYEIKTQNGNYWTIRDIKRILTNVSYIGLIPWNPKSGLTYKGKHHPIVSEEVFAKAQEIIKKKPKHKRDSISYSHWLSGLIKCGNCGRSMGYNPQANKTARFRCIGNTRGLCRPTNSIDTKKAEEMIRVIFNDIIKNSYKIKRKSVIFNSDNISAISNLENTLQKLRRKLKRHEQAYAEEIDTIEEYKRNKKDTLNEIEHIINQLKTVKHKLFEETAKDSLNNESLSLLDILFNDGYSVMQKNTALRKIIHHIVYDKNADKFTVFFNF